MGNKQSSAPARFEGTEKVESRLRNYEIKQLYQLLGNVRFCLVYKGSAHGFTPRAFHLKSDGQGPTLVVAYSNAGCIYGGFTNEGFWSREMLVKDEKAFLFCLNTGDGHNSPLRIPVKNANGAIKDHSTQGPNFGNGDLCFLNSDMQVSITETNYYEFNAVDLHGGDTTFVECEAYRVEGIDAAMEVPWRKVTWTVEEKQILMEYARKYTPPFKVVEQPHVLMVGPVGAGKSSFINSVNSVFRCHVTSQAAAGSDATSVTTKYNTYTIRDGREGNPLPFLLCDSMGLEEKTGTGLETEDILKILDGHVPDRYQFNPIASIQPSTAGYITSPALKDKIHCVVFVLDACKVGILSKDLKSKLTKLKAQIRQHDVPLMVLLTKVDELCPLVAEDVSNVYRSRAVETEMNTVNAQLGIPVSSIVPVKNYSSKLELVTNNDILILNALQQIMRFADTYFDNMPEGLQQSPS